MDIGEKKAITVKIYVFYALFGIAKNIIGPILPHLIDDYTVSLATAGLVISLLSFGRLLSVSWATVWLDEKGPKKVLLWGAFCVAAGLIGFTLSIWWYLHLFFMAVIGIGFGLFGSSSNALIAGLYIKKQGKALNRLHMFYGVGALIGPLLAGIFLFMDFSWRSIFILVSILAVSLFLMIIFQKIPEINNNGEYVNDTNKNGTKDNKGKYFTRLKKLFKSPVFFLLALISFIYIGVGNGITGWMNTYLGDTFAFTDIFASGILAIYTLGITLGRIVCSYVSDDLGYKNTIFYCSIGSFLAVCIAVLSNSTVFILTGFGLTGFFLAGLFPTALAYGSRVFDDMLGTISSALISTAVIGGMLIPWWMGIISEYYGLRSGMYLTIIFSIILIFTAGLLYKFDKQ